MQYFPVTIIDDFFNNPDKVRELALGCEYNPSPLGHWPGIRSPKLHLIDQSFFDKFCLKLLSIFYDRNFHNINFNIDAYFQKIKPFDNDPKSNKNKGWVHYDDKIFGGIIYLTPTISYSSGTSVYHTNDKFDLNKLLTANKQKHNFYLHNDDTNYDKSYKKYAKMFDETVNVSNVYNRLILVDGQSWHAAQNFYVEEERLTLVFFVDKIESTGSTPIHRIKQIDI